MGDEVHKMNILRNDIRNNETVLDFVKFSIEQWILHKVLRNTEEISINRNVNLSKNLENSKYSAHDQR